MSKETKPSPVIVTDVLGLAAIVNTAVAMAAVIGILAVVTSPVWGLAMLLAWLVSC